MNHRFRKMGAARTLAILIAASFVLYVANGKAQNKEPESQSAANDEKECTPKCRPQYVCIEGECKSPCNPPCRATEICTGNGRCIPSSSTPSQKPQIDSNSAVVDVSNKKADQSGSDEQAKQEEDGSGETANPKECIPKCRDHYTCIEGECKSPCNPPCQVTEICTGNGRCIPTEPVQTVEPGVTIIRNQQIFHSEKHLRYNMHKYDSFQRNRNIGIVFISSGISVALAGISMAVARVAKYKDGPEGMSLKSVGVGSMVIGTIFAVGGVLLVNYAPKGREKAKAGFYEPKSSSTKYVEPDSKKDSSKKRSKVRISPFGVQF